MIDSLPLGKGVTGHALACAAFDLDPGVPLSLSLSLIRKEKNPRHDDGYNKEFFNVFDKICMRECPKINLFISSTI